MRSEWRTTSASALARSVPLVLCSALRPERWSTFNALGIVATCEKAIPFSDAHANGVTGVGGAVFTTLFLGVNAAAMIGHGEAHRRRSPFPTGRGLELRHVLHATMWTCGRRGLLGFRAPRMAEVCCLLRRRPSGGGYTRPDHAFLPPSSRRWKTGSCSRRAAANETTDALFRGCSRILPPSSSLFIVWPSRRCALEDAAATTCRRMPTSQRLCLCVCCGWPLVVPVP